MKIGLSILINGLLQPEYHGLNTGTHVVWILRMYIYSDLND